MTYYVGPGGSDTNAGTSYATRFLTLSKAATAVSAGGDIVYASPGTYRELITVSVSGGNAYTTGTVTATNGSTTITGSGTTFTGGNVVAGYYFKVQGCAPKLISAVNTSTEIILAEAYDGPTVAGATYITYNPIKWIGDYSGANTDGVGGVVRITGSADDITASRASCITATAKNYQHFTGFAFDMAVSWQISLIACKYWLFDKCCSQANIMASNGNGNFVNSNSVNQLGISITNCFAKDIQGDVVVFTESSDLNNSGHIVQNCIFTGTNTTNFTGTPSACITVENVGGVTIKNCDLSGSTYGVRIKATPAPGQTVTVLNNIIHSCQVGLLGVTLGDITENFNTFFCVGSTRATVNSGTDSITYPPLWDMRWFFETVA